MNSSSRSIKDRAAAPNFSGAILRANTASRPEGVFTRATVEELIRRSPFVPNIREALDRLEARGIIVVVDELPASVGMRQKGVA